MIKVSAPGKVHISGEHSVVYGKLALLAAINKRCFVKLESCGQTKIVLEDQNLKMRQTTSFDQIRHFSYLASKAWQDALIRGNNSALKIYRKDPFCLVKIAVNEVYKYLEKKPLRGFEMIIDSKIPISMGLGSSAALVASVVGVMLYSEEKKIDKEVVNKIAYGVEKIQHFTPSGGDNTTVCFGGFLKFKKQNNKLDFETIRLKAGKSLDFLLIDSGRPEETTGEMVALVRSKYETSNIEYKKLLRKMGKVTEEIIDAVEINDGKKIKKSILENEKLLEALGVVGKRACRVIRYIESKDVAAKICGSGGVKKGSGIILAFLQGSNQLKEVLLKKKIDFMTVKLGQEGLRVEES